ncbi:hypothetical protein GCM10023176_57020 [Micromonospora coerulea]|uniref:Uncharacterized protein n=1 Tax=Micromonospora coerulea TaxID=47856 RepID=A0ABP8T473_9ACTN
MNITSPANGSSRPSDISVTGTSNADPSACRLILVVNGEDRSGTLRGPGAETAPGPPSRQSVS